MKIDQLKKIRVLALSSLLILAACGLSLMQTLKTTLDGAGPVVDSFQAAGKIKPEEGQKLKGDFKQFSGDADAIAAASTKPERIRAVRALSDHFVAAAPDFHLGHPEANSKFSTVYTIAEGIVTSIEIYYGAPPSNNRTAAAERAPTGARPTEESIRRQIEELKKALTE